MPILRQQLRGSPLAFPGRLPGFDPAHVVARGCRFSGSAFGASNFINLLNAKIGTQAGAPSSVISGTVGPAVQFSSASTLDKLTYSGQSTANDGQVTLGAIVRPKSAGLNNPVIFNSGNAAGGWQFTTVGSVLVLQDGSYSHIANSGFVLAANVPYFVACSTDSATATNFVVLRLDNGKVLANSQASITTTASNGIYSIGGTGQFAGNVFDGAIAATMFSASYASLATLLQWASDPWAFWYPRTNYGAIDIGTLIAAGGFKAAWAQQNNYPVIGTGTY